MKSYQAASSPSVGRSSDRIRWSLHVVILCFPMIMAISQQLSGHHTAIPAHVSRLAPLLVMDLVVWGIVFTVAFLISKSTATQLWMKTQHPLRTVRNGILWAFALWIAANLAFAALAWVFPKMVSTYLETMIAFSNIKNVTTHPKLVFMAYGIIGLITGFTEELWRAGMLLGLDGLFPQLREKRYGPLMAIVGVSVLFGMAHSYQGKLGIAQAFVIGILFGLILVYRRSYWEVAITHSLYDSCGLWFTFYMVRHHHLDLVLPWLHLH